MRDALFDLRPLGLARARDAAPELLRTLQRAELVVVHHETEQRSEGAGDRSRRRSVTVLTLQP